MHDPRERLIVALDVSSATAAQAIVNAIGESASIYKVGMQLYTAEGPKIVRDLIASGRRIFLDLKYHDIPNTVASAVKEAATLKVDMLTVHASGGSKMLRAATNAASSSNPALMILAVTVLTSLDDADVAEVGFSGSPQSQVLKLAELALKAGCQGIVSSAQEVPALRARLGANFAIVTPGVRPSDAGRGDQVRVVTPAEAIAAGSTHLVIGRPITAAQNPAGEARMILQEISSQLAVCGHDGDVTGRATGL